jgi:hypothetical protein
MRWKFKAQKTCVIAKVNLEEIESIELLSQNYKVLNVDMQEKPVVIHGVKSGLRECLFRTFQQTRTDTVSRRI